MNGKQSREELLWLEHDGKCDMCGARMQPSRREYPSMHVYDCTDCDRHRGFTIPGWTENANEALTSR